MPWRLKRKSQLFIESDVEGNWVYHIKQPQIDKGKGWMETADLDPEDKDVQAQYWADIHRLVEMNGAIACSFEALVTLLVDWLPVLRLGKPDSASLEEEEGPEDAKV